MKLTARTRIKCDLPRLWAYTQEPDQHAPWDLRFSEISYLPKARPEDPQRFRYATRIGFGLAVVGWGESTASAEARRSVLAFGSDSPWSLIREGGGYWEFQEGDGWSSLATVYDYRTRGGALGRLLDRGVFRPLMVWATRWSFDRLRLWIESEVRPELSLRLWGLKVGCRTALALVWCLEGLVPKLLVVSPSELQLVQRSGLVIGSPALTLGLLGSAEVVFGLWMLVGVVERTLAVLSILGVLGLGTLVAWTEPSSLANPFGGLTKNLALLACAGAVLLLEPWCPKARRARP